MPHQGSPFMLPDYTSGVPRVHHHLSWTGFNGLPFKTPPSSEENTFFMSTHKLCLGLFTKSPIIVPLSNVAYFSQIPTSWKWLCLSTSIYFSTCKPAPSAPLTFIHLVTRLLIKKQKRGKLNPLAFGFVDRLNSVQNLLLFLSDVNPLSNKEKSFRQACLSYFFPFLVFI